MGKKLMGGCIALAVLLALSPQFLLRLLPKGMDDESYDLVTLQGSDIAYTPLASDQSVLKALGLMDPNATKWEKPVLTQEDLGEPLGSVGWSYVEKLIGCDLYRWAEFPELEEVCILDRNGEFRLYRENGTFHAPNGTGLPVTEVEEEVLSAPGILREDFELTEDHREFWLDISGDGEEEHLAIGKEDRCLYVVEGKTAWEAPADAFLWEIGQRLELKAEGTAVGLGERLVDAAAVLEAQSVTEVVEAGFSAGHQFFEDAAAKRVRLVAELQVEGRQKKVGILLTAAEFSGRIGYEDGTFTLSDWELSGISLN